MLGKDIIAIQEQQIKFLEDMNEAILREHDYGTNLNWWFRMPEKELLLHTLEVNHSNGYMDDKEYERLKQLVKEI